MFLQDRLFPGGVRVTDPWFWIMMSAAALTGSVSLYPLNLWLAKKDYFNWSGWLAGIDSGIQPAGEVNAPSFRSAWGALVLSLGLFIGSVVLMAAVLG